MIEKKGGDMNKILLIVIVMAVAGLCQPIAHDSCGIAIELREKYGPVVHDTGTMITMVNNCFVITHRDSPNTFYPVGNYAVSKVTKLKQEDSL